MAAMTVKESAAFHRQGGVDDIAFNPRGCGQLDLTGADGTLDLAADNHRFGNDFTINRGFLANGERPGADIAFNASIQLNFTLGREGTMEHHIGADDRGGFRFHGGPFDGGRLRGAGGAV